MDSHLAGSPDAQSWGVDSGYWDIAGRWRDAPPGTIAVILEAMGAHSPSPPEDRPMIVVAQGESWPELPPGTLVLEDGGSTEWGSQDLAPCDVPIGYHLFEPAGQGGHEEPGGRRTGDLPVSLAVCPACCPSPGAAGRSWGWAAQLYAARSGQSWGIGDFADLRRLAAWSGSHGAGFVLLNPLHAPQPGPDPGPSPYFPSSRCFLNPLYLRIEDVPGAAALPGLDRLAADGRYLNGHRLIDRRRVWELKSGALEALFERFENAGGDRRFAEYVAQRGSVLDGYSTFCALAEQHGVPWQSWPAELRSPDAPAVARFAASRKGERRKRYHAWLQWNCERQLASAGGPGLLIDLAVGVDRGGADAWLWQDVYTMGMGVGAPPDDFNVAGQDWSLPPWDPWLLRGAAYAPYIETLRAAMRHAAGLRLDHVMGLFRLFWVPQGCEPSQGAYVRYPWRDMVNLLCLEAWRAGAFVVGEDLGTVEDHVREALFGAGVLSYRLAWFEAAGPLSWPTQALAAVSTHDLPTIAGLWSGSDEEAQRRTGLGPGEERAADMRRRLCEWAGCDSDWPVPKVIEAAYAMLSQAPCELVAAALEDALAVEERPNMPGTTTQWPNWRLALPAPLEEIERSELSVAIAARLGERRGR